MNMLHSVSCYTNPKNQAAYGKNQTNMKLEINPTAEVFEPCEAGPNDFSLCGETTLKPMHRLSRFGETETDALLTLP